MKRDNIVIPCRQKCARRRPTDVCRGRRSTVDDFPDRSSLFSFRPFVSSPLFSSSFFSFPFYLLIVVVVVVVWRLTATRSDTTPRNVWHSMNNTHVTYDIQVVSAGRPAFIMTSRIVFGTKNRRLSCLVSRARFCRRWSTFVQTCKSISPEAFVNAFFNPAVTRFN